MASLGKADCRKTPSHNPAKSSSAWPGAHPLKTQTSSQQSGTSTTMQGRMNGLQNMMAAKVGRQETLDRRWVFLLVALSMGPKRINLYSTSCRIMCGMVTLFLFAKSTTRFHAKNEQTAMNMTKIFKHDKNSNSNGNSNNSSNSNNINQSTNQ